MLYRLRDITGEPIVRIVEDVSHHPRHAKSMWLAENPIFTAGAMAIPTCRRYEDSKNCPAERPWHVWIWEGGFLYDQYAVEVVRDPQGEEVVDYPRERPTPLTYIATSDLIARQRKYIRWFFGETYETDTGRMVDWDERAFWAPDDPVLNEHCAPGDRIYREGPLEPVPEANKQYFEIKIPDFNRELDLQLHAIQKGDPVSKPVPDDPVQAANKCGWIAPNGDYYACGYWRHEEWEQVALQEGWYGKQPLQQQGWVVVSTNGLKHKKEPTQAQIDVLFDLGKGDLGDK